VLGALPPALRASAGTRPSRSPVSRRLRRHARRDFPVTVGGYTRDAGLYEAPLADGATALLVDCPELYDRPGIYGLDTTDYPDSPRRFAFLARAALEHAARSGARPTIVHAHDWQAGLVPVYLKTMYASHPVLAGTPSVFTIHNLAYQGAFESDWLPRLDLGWDQFTIDRLEYHGRISPAQRGHQRRRRDHDRQPALRQGNSDARVRLRLRRDPARAPGTDSGRHPQRHRHARMGSGPRSVSAEARRYAGDQSEKAGGEKSRCSPKRAFRPTR
jgi:hypothetical protein